MRRFTSLALLLLLLAPTTLVAQDRWLTLVDRDGGRADLDLPTVLARDGLYLVSLRWFVGGTDATYTIERQMLDCREFRTRILRIDHFSRGHGAADSLLRSEQQDTTWISYGGGSLGADALRVACHVAPSLARTDRSGTPSR